ncbi:acyl-CoA dehydrogenase family protein [Pseudonocardia sp. NPDC049154]|uniref:acyl-CoA dehydrogenase family protein n=1 Tax=Pseudonocardia sp. NPDC049154 TaxID=3155501 RepID=UPI0033D68133
MSELRELVRDVVGGGGEVWKTLTELGLTTIGVPEEAGGSGGTLHDLVEVAEALGEHGVAVPFAEHATACRALAGHREPPALGTVAVGRPGRVVAPWASRASHLVLLSPDGTATVSTPVGRVVTPGTDPAGQPLDEVEVQTGRLLTGVDSAQVLTRLALLRAATLVGALRGAYLLTREHVRTREQFGRPLVKLPAVATALARLRVELLQAETALAAALDLAETPRARDAAATARVVCGSAATEGARIAHQLHGALGITQEYALHPLTRLLWATRDADLPEHDWAALLGRRVADGGEEVLWDELTAVVAT